MTSQEKLWALAMLAWRHDTALLCKTGRVGIAGMSVSGHSDTLASAVNELWSEVTHLHDGYPAVPCADLKSRWLLIWIDDRWITETEYNTPTTLVECPVCCGQGKRGYTKPEKGRWIYVAGACDDCLRGAKRGQP